MNNLFIFSAILLSGIGVGCGEESVEEVEKDYLEGFTNPKSDAASNSSFYGPITTRGYVKGNWEDGTIGFSVELGKGAKFKVSLSGVRGARPMDTAILMYGPFERLSSPGELLLASDNGPDTLAAPDLIFVAPEDGSYFLVIAAEDAPKSRSYYTLGFGCEGTEEQCRMYTECRDNGLILSKSGISSVITLEKDTVWATGCEVLFDTPVTVPEGVTLTVEPGVKLIHDMRAPWKVFGTLNFEGSEMKPIISDGLDVELKTGGSLSFDNFTINGDIDIQQSGGTLTLNNFLSDARVKINQKDGFLSLNNFSCFNAGIIQSGGELRIEDSVFWKKERSRFTSSTAIQVKEGKFEMFSSFIRGYTTGITFENTNSAQIENSYIVDNGVGILMTGQNPITPADIQADRICDVSTWPPFSTDPIILNSEISRNEKGIVVQGQDVLFEIESSNLNENSDFAVQIFAHQIHPETFFKNNNIMGNNAESSLERQFETFHHMNDLFLDGNYIPKMAQIEPWFSHCLGEINEVNPSAAKLVDAGPQEPLSQSVKDSAAQYLLD